MENQLLILFGKTGVGKNYVAGIFQKKFGFHIYDADVDLTQEMNHAIENNLRFTDSMRSRYFDIVMEKTRKLLSLNCNVVLCQGLFKNKNRKDLLHEFPSACFIWVDAEEELIENRVLNRKSNVTVEYARKINESFEEPDFKCRKILNNNGEEEVLHQAKKIIRDLTTGC